MSNKICLGFSLTMYYSTDRWNGAGLSPRAVPFWSVGTIENTYGDYVEIRFQSKSQPTRADFVDIRFKPTQNLAEDLMYYPVDNIDHEGRSIITELMDRSQKLTTVLTLTVLTQFEEKYLQNRTYRWPK